MGNLVRFALAPFVSIAAVGCLGLLACGGPPGAANSQSSSSQTGADDGGAPPTSNPPGSSPGATRDDAGSPSTGLPGATSDAAAPHVDAGPRAPTGDAGGTVGPTGLVHPGVLDSKASLDFVKAQIAAGKEPWLSAFNAAKSSPYAAPWATVLAASAANGGPAANVECGSFSNPDVSCTAEKYDASAAYTSALLWYFTGDTAYAQAAIANMNAWSAVLKQHTDSNAPVQSGWVGEVFPRAAEIIRYSGAGWADADVAQFSAMLTSAYVPYIQAGAPKENGNWELSMIDALFAIGVFNDDAAMVQKAATMWRARVPAYIYLTSDGPTPVLPPGGDYSASTIATFWYGQTQLVDGVSQETCRDLGHVQYGFAAMINAAETARIQGIDLYGEEKTRITAGLEYHAAFLDGAAVPSSLCSGKLTAVTPDPMWEIAFNEYSSRLGGSLPSTSTLVTKIRPTSVDHHMDWETLTHAELGASGL